MAEHGGVGTPHSRGAPGTGLLFGVGEVGSFSWRSRARRLVGSVTRRRGGSRLVGSPQPACRFFVCAVVTCHHLHHCLLQPPGRS